MKQLLRAAMFAALLVTPFLPTQAGTYQITVNGEYAGSCTESGTYTLSNIAANGFSYDTSENRTRTCTNFSIIQGISISGTAHATENSSATGNSGTTSGSMTIDYFGTPVSVEVDVAWDDTGYGQGSYIRLNGIDQPVGSFEVVLDVLYGFLLD